ncbi:MAG: hypothetical protein KME60_03130 [Cyanomargarita calcarea GSE-NOS-MK-12-04C]|jgi:hypothetical protein|uniref:Uncharacterized protein n=1 Tax=Cyanomargarita calcarea GSE-NOS-MK-12-04C TaxID=2839659 RepID=A0A951UQJ0_9CYAN|nr:hypothetical protein [Cyanomargarita calcarea GSE-NOS-MK-12-04C]
MSKFSDLIGSINNLFQIGIGGTGARSLRFKNANNGDLVWTPTANRTLTLPDTTGTIATTANIPSLAPIFLGTKEYGDTHQSLSAGVFGNNIGLPNILTDILGKWNSTSKTYTIATTGNYLILSKLRVPDNLGVMGWGQGVHTSTADGSFFFWDVIRTGATNNRNIIVNTRIAAFNANDILNFFTYVDSATVVWVASLTIIRLS